MAEIELIETLLISDCKDGSILSVDKHSINNKSEKIRIIKWSNKATKSIKIILEPEEAKRIREALKDL